MPMHRRLPKRGFVSKLQNFNAEITLSALNRAANKVQADVIDLAALQRAKIIGTEVRTLKLIKSGQIDRAVTLRGIAASEAARESVLACGGKWIEEDSAAVAQKPKKFLPRSASSAAKGA